MKTRKTIKYIFIIIIVIIVCIIAQLLLPSSDFSYKEKIKHQDMETTAKELALCYIMTLNDQKIITPSNMNIYAKNNRIKPINNSKDLKFLFRKRPPDEESDIIILAIRKNLKENFIAVRLNNNTISLNGVNVDLDNFIYFPKNWPDN